MPFLTTDEWLAPAVRQPAQTKPVLVRFPAMMWGVLFVGLGVACYIGGVLLAAVRHLLAPWLPTDEIVRTVLWYSGMPVVAGFLLIVFEIVALVPMKRAGDGGGLRLDRESHDDGSVDRVQR